jgi:hypothetical protein
MSKVLHRRNKSKVIGYTLEELLEINPGAGAEMLVEAREARGARCETSALSGNLCPMNRRLRGMSPKRPSTALPVVPWDWTVITGRDSRIARTKIDPTEQPKPRPEPGRGFFVSRSACIRRAVSPQVGQRSATPIIEPFVSAMPCIVRPSSERGQG